MDLPMDLVIRMMQYMSFRDLSCAAAVCKLWREQADKEKVIVGNFTAPGKKL
jgi:hypothetical protein